MNHRHTLKLKHFPTLKGLFKLYCRKALTTGKGHQQEAANDDLNYGWHNELTFLTHAMTGNSVEHSVIVICMQYKTWKKNETPKIRIGTFIRRYQRLTRYVARDPPGDKQLVNVQLQVRVGDVRIPSLLGQ